MWLLFAVLSAVFAALTALLAKVGTAGVDSSLATAIRTVVVLAMAWGMVFVTGSGRTLSQIPARSWWFLILSGLATGASWLCYFRALENGPVSAVVPVDKMSVVLTVLLAWLFLDEEMTAKTAVGCALISVGTLFMVP